MEFTLLERNVEKKLDLLVNQVYCVGYASRDQEKVKEHIRELEKIGVPAPLHTPTVYCVDKNLLTKHREIKVQGKRTSGEVEVVLVIQKSKLYITVGSDHTDRELEKESIEQSKQVCEKPVASQVWDYDAIKDHWDSLIIRSWITDQTGKHIYQEGSVKELLAVDDLLQVIKLETNIPLEGSAIYSGTTPTKGGFIYASKWDLELEDPVLGQKIQHHYAVSK